MFCCFVEILAYSRSNLAKDRLVWKAWESSKVLLRFECVACFFKSRLEINSNKSNAFIILRFLTIVGGMDANLMEKLRFCRCSEALWNHSELAVACQGLVLNVFPTSFTFVTIVALQWTAKLCIVVLPCLGKGIVSRR